MVSWARDRVTGQEVWWVRWWIKTWKPNMRHLDEGTSPRRSLLWLPMVHHRAGSWDGCCSHTGASLCPSKKKPKAVEFLEKDKCQQGWGETETLPCHYWVCNVVQALWKSLTISQEVKQNYHTTLQFHPLAPYSKDGKQKKKYSFVHEAHSNTSHNS